MLPIEDRIRKFAESMIPFKDKYSRDMLVEFYDYWTEKNRSETKFKAETEKTWELNKRLARWYRNTNKFKKNVTAKDNNNLADLARTIDEMERNR